MVDLIVYETLKRNEATMPIADIIIFTSPSNVEAWFEKYSINKNQKVIAMGDATANTLRNHRVFPKALADAFDDTGMARAVFGVSGFS